MTSLRARPFLATGQHPATRYVGTHMKNSTVSTIMPTLVFILAVLINPVQAKAEAQSADTAELYAEILNMDRTLFGAFNACDLDTYKLIVSEDLEFYDDRFGLNTSRDKEILSFKDRCGPDNKSKVRRELIEEELEVHRLGEYGALQIGAHNFYVVVEGEEKLVETARFIHIWKKHNGSWTVGRVVSYDHRAQSP